MEQIHPDVRDAEVNAGNVIEILDVRLTIEYIGSNFPIGPLPGSLAFPRQETEFFRSKSGAVRFRGCRFASMF